MDGWMEILEAKTYLNMRFEVLTAVMLKIQVFWDVTLCHWVSGCQCSEEPYCLHP